MRCGLMLPDGKCFGVDNDEGCPDPCPFHVPAETLEEGQRIRSIVAEMALYLQARCTGHQTQGWWEKLIKSMGKKNAVAVLGTARFITFRTKLFLYLPGVIRK